MTDESDSVRQVTVAGAEEDSNHDTGNEIKLEVDTATRVNFASAQNDVPVLRRLLVRNLSADAIEKIEVKLEATPSVIRPKTWVIDRLSPEDEQELRDLDTPLDLPKLSGLDEKELGELTVTVRTGQEVLAEKSSRLELLARDQWGGLADMDRLLAAYVSPNDASVAAVLKEASALLERAGHDGSLEGYQSGNPQRAWMIAGAIWSAVTGMGLTYTNPPASFERDGQKVRSPARIRSEGLATCLDTSLFLAGAWEQAGLHPVILFGTGHAWCGVWLTERDFGQVTEPDVVAVRKATQAREFVSAETTMLTRRPTVGFDEAVEAGRARLVEEREHEFLMAVDITRARAARIRPLASHVPASDEFGDHAPAAPAGLPKPLELGELPEDVIEPVPDTPKGRIERWQSKLLDLSLRNRLLNFKTTKQTVPCMVPDLGALEDALAAGEAFNAYPLKEDDPIGERRVSLEERERIIGAAVKDAYDRGQVTVPLDRREMDNRLLSLHRKAKSDLQEGGTNTLFMAAGFLRWQREGERRDYRAPLLLVPVKLERRSARSRFQIKHHEDEVRFNATLLEFLKRDFDLFLPELEGELPRDDSGIDLPLIFQLVRNKVRDVAGFEVVDEIAISTFSFAKYLMWKDLVDRTDDLRNNRLVAHLVDNPDQPFEPGGGEPVAAADIDRKVAPKDLVTPLPADSSQLAAVVAAEQGQDFVLIGPPGTGKSQTIANIICQCMAHGKTVLFVAEKAAALDVVHRRLEAHGLGDAVLELHSNKTDRKRVLTQLGRGWDRASRGSGEDWIEVNEKLRVQRDRLNAYVQALHAPGSQGFSIFEAVSWVAGERQGLELSFDNKDAHDRESFAHRLDIADVLGRTHRATSGGPRIPLVASSTWSYEWQNELIETARALRAAADRAIGSANQLAGVIGFSQDREGTQYRRRLLSRLTARARGDADDLSRVPDLQPSDLRAEADRFATAAKGLERANAALSASYPEREMRRLPLDQLDADWRAAQATFWPFSALKRRSVRKLLQTYASTGAAEPGADLPALYEARGHLEALEKNSVSAIAGEDRQPSRVTRLIDQAISLRAVLAEARDDVADNVAFGAATAGLTQGPDSRLRDALRDWDEASAALANALNEFERASGRPPETETLTALMRDLDTVLANREKLADWTRWNDARGQAAAAGLDPLAERLEAGEITGDVVLAFRRAYARWWLPLAFDASDELRQFAHWDHEDSVRAFRDLDDAASEQAPAEVMRRIQHGLPARDGVPRKSELGTLRYQLGLQRPSMAIRALLGNLSETLPKLAPCVLMSPLSIAQYLPADQAVFDVVIFDEASQITTWDAVGAIARARQSIVVGDPKQLPPTNFFGRSDEGEEDGADPLLGDMPSILDEVATAGIPTRRLDWHYRSRDEALIAFSNHFYYDGGLVTFPAPATGSEALRFHKIKGTYARGSGRTNADEAKAIVALIRRRLTAWLGWPEEKRPTLGVITFNSQQQGLILDLLDEVRRNNPELEWFFADEREEPVIVKNLENIQGDERDVMLFSITFAPDAAGKLTMNFGALNNDGGEKRLNVAVTRARQELHIFSSITHDQIDLSRTRAVGVRDLKTFLDYAERGAVALPARDQGSLGPAENPFEEAVADAFRAEGWEVRTQIGVSGFRVDLGIVNPDRAGAYLAGIECDGAAYHSSATARDRDKVRQAVLEGLGWTILRIWSTDWFRNPKAVVERLHDELEALLRADREARVDSESDPDEPDVSEPLALDYHEEDDDQPTPMQLPTPEPADQQHFASSTATAKEPAEPESIQPDPDRFFDPDYLPELKLIITEIVAEKAPLPVTRLAREVANSHGWQRTGRRIMTRVEEALDDLEIVDELGERFVWPSGEHRSRIAYRGLEDRSIQEVSFSEIASVLDTHSRRLLGAEDPVLDLARQLGISRLSSGARSHLERIWSRYQSEQS